MSCAWESSFTAFEGKGDSVLSIVIPARNEEDSLEPLHREIDAVLNSSGLEAEIVVVDDGSTDGTWSRIVALAALDPRVRGFRLRRHFGKAAALSAAVAHIQGDPVITLDADLQDDPAAIPRLIEKLEAGYDLVSGWRRQRFDPWHKLIPSRLFNGFVGVFSGLKLHDHNCGLKCYRSEVVQEIRLYGELHSFITLLAHRSGFRITEIETRHRPRRYGRSKYGPTRLITGLMDLSTLSFLGSFRRRLIHLLGGLGLLAFAGGISGLAYLAGVWVSGEGPIGSRPLLIYSVASLFLGGQMMTLGILAELITSPHRGLGQADPRHYSISERVGKP